MKKTMSMNSESLYWLTNKEWYTIDEKNDKFVLTEAAPTKARISFEIWSGKRKSTRKKTFFSKMK